MAEVYITDGLRTFIGLKDKAYKNIPAEDLAAAVLSQLRVRGENEGLHLESVICGNATGGGGNIARLALLKAGFCDSVSGISLDAQCASGLESIIAGWTRIKSGMEDAVIAGGTESASTRCIRFYNPNHPNFDPARTDNSYLSAQFIPEDWSENSMIRGADETCRKYGFAPEELAESAALSHQRAFTAAQKKIFDSITVSVNGLIKDEGIRKSMTKEFALRLKPVLQDGIITPATSCLFNDGAAFLTLCGENKIKNHKGPLFKIRQAVSTGSDRFLSPESLIFAIEKLIEKSGLEEKQIDRIDYNEAFACLNLLYKRRFSAPANCFGGALSYGHPYGASGAVVTLHLMKAMELNGETFGIAAVPAAGGVASAILLERVQ